MMETSTLVYLNLAFSSYMLAITWYAHLTHYPLLKVVSLANFKSYHSKYVNATLIPIGIPMLGELAVSILLALTFEKIYLLSFIILVAIWCVTFLWSVRCHSRLEVQFEEKAYQSLMLSNLIRSFLWTLKLILAIFIIQQGVN